MASRLSASGVESREELLGNERLGQNCCRSLRSNPPLAGGIDASTQNDDRDVLGVGRHLDLSQGLFSDPPGMLTSSTIASTGGVRFACIRPRTASKAVNTLWPFARRSAATNCDKTRSSSTTRTVAIIPSLPDFERIRSRSHGRCVNLLHHLLRALGADAVGEVEIRMRTQVGLDLLPVVRLVSNFLEVAANGQESLQSLHMGEISLDLRDPGGEAPLQPHHPLADAHARLQLHGVEGFGDIVVGGNFTSTKKKRVAYATRFT